MARFAELLARSCFSFLEGASQPEELVERGRALGLEAMALCDRDGLYGSVRMHVAGKEHGQRVIVGAELTLEEPGALAAPAPGRAPGDSRPTLALLVEDHEGYAALCQLLTAAHRKGEAGIGIDRIAASPAGLFALVPLDPRRPHTDVQLDAVRQAFAGRAAIAVWRHLDPVEPQRLERARAAGQRFDLPLVASARPLYHHRSRKPLADVVRCIRLRTTLERAGTLLSPNAEAELKPAAAMLRLFAGEPDLVARSLDIAARCRFSLAELRYRFPCGGGAAGLDPNEVLRLRVEQGGARRYPQGVPPEVRAQLHKELALIAELEVAPYFLSVLEIVEIARSRGILCQGRGSAANSAVCFVLGITAVDPARSALLFERFMSAARSEPPDIDVDFEHERREEVIQEIYRRYGRDRAAMVSELVRYRGRSALREVGKVFGLSGDQLGRLSGMVGHWGDTSDLSDARLARRGLDPGDRRLRQVIALGRELCGMPRHLSVHVGGFVLSAEPLWRVAPVKPARMPGRTVIPWDKDDLDALGFFKVDVLGLGILTAIRKALGLVQARGAAPGATYDPIEALARIPAEDPAVYEAVCRADTVGVFQIESRAQMAMLPLLRPREFYDLVVEVGIVRPGPIQGKMVHPYLRRRTGEEPVSYPHPSLAGVLARTLGVPLFQEQVMQIAIVGAGYSGGEADQLRRDMAAWRLHGRLERHRKGLLAGFARRGIEAEFGERLFQQIMGFGEYGFPESHAASFALLVYASAWLKVHEPAAFACALLNSQPMGFYGPSTIVRDAQKHGVEVRPACALRSDWDCTLEPGGASTQGERPALRLGLRLVHGLGQAAAQRIVAARRERAYGGVGDFLHATGLRRDEAERLAEAGALAAISPSRREALWRVRAPRGEGLFDGRPLEPAAPVALPALGPQAELALDYASVGLSLVDHPMRHVRLRLGRRRVRRAVEQQRWVQDEEVSVAGVVIARQRPMTAKGIVFITIEDETGTVNLVVYPHVMERYELVAQHAGIMLARGRVDRRGEVVHVRARTLERLDLPAASPLRLRSRDF
ncbi:MAG: error-prone DNA polymerase [Deltaproteobacteria bacterium]|nr:error-prone DNA polymerase [Deltaproteobacteria bacterium]